MAIFYKWPVNEAVTGDDVVIFPEELDHLDANLLSGCGAGTIIFEKYVDFVDRNRDFPNLKRLIFEQGVGTLRGAFCDCPVLAELVIRDSLDLMEGGAFGNCPALSEVSLPDCLYTLSEQMMEAPYFKRPELYSDGFLYVGDVLMATDPGLSGSVAVRPGTRAIAARCFARRAVTSCLIPDSVASIGEFAFADSGLVEVFIPGSLSVLPMGCFSGCLSLRKVVFGEGVRRLGNSCFKGCPALVSVSFPASLSMVGLAAPFAGCGGLKDAVVEAFSEVGADSGSGVDFTGAYEGFGVDSAGADVSSGASRDAGCAGDVALCTGDDSDSTGAVAVSGADGSRAVVDSTGSCAAGAVINFPAGSFAERMVMRDKYLCPENYVITGREAILEDYFEGALFSSVTIAGDVRRIKSRAFYRCPNLRRIIIREGVEFIGISAFSGCRLEEMCVPSTVRELCGSVFMNHCRRIVIAGEPLWWMDPDRDYWYYVDEIEMLSEKATLRYDPEHFSDADRLAVPKTVKLIAPEGSVAKAEWEEFQRRVTE